MLLAISRIKKRKFGFTLIELLIVIAIILILISIALPNFLEARMRAQVVKARGEISSLRTAFEMYMQEFKVYPRGCIPRMGSFPSGYCQDNWGFAGSSRGGHLTTPIKYIKSIPDDLFAVDYTILGSVNSFPAGHPWVKYRTTRRLVWNATTPDDLPKQIIPKNKQAGCWSSQFDIINPTMFKNKQYFISSLGPDHDEDLLPFYAASVSGYKAGDEFYSPTNGTVSSGDMAFVGP